MRATLGGYSDVGLLDECERSEDNATICYQMALEQPLPEAVKEIVERQAKAALLSRDQMGALREQLRGQH